MSLDLALDDDERLIAESVERFCTAHRVEETVKHGEGVFDRALWRAFCAQGFWALGSEAGARSSIAMVEVLGKHVFPGPVIETMLAVTLLDGAAREQLIAGELIVSAGSPPSMAFAREASLWLELDGQQVYRVTPSGPLTEVASLGGEPWATGMFVRSEPFERAPAALLHADIALAAYLAAAAFALLMRTAEHAATRKQFGKAIGSFQAVSHPLASCHISLSAAATLARAAACALDEGQGDPTRAHPLACAALVSAKRAALETAYVCHQKLGAIGITLEGPAHHVTRRIRSLATRATARIEQTEATLLSSLGA